MQAAARKLARSFTAHGLQLAESVSKIREADRGSWRAGRSSRSADCTPNFVTYTSEYSSFSASQRFRKELVGLSTRTVATCYVELSNTVETSLNSLRVASSLELLDRSRKGYM